MSDAPVDTSSDARVPGLVDASRPNAARIYDFLLGGKDNYAVDQMVAQRMLAIAPDTRTMAWFSRQFLDRAVQRAAEDGIRQFVDIGAGIPYSPNVYETAQDVDPSARVVAIDYDPVVHVHHNALCAAPGVTSMLADVRRPDELLARLRIEELIDFDQPVALLLVGVMHFVMDEEEPASILATLLSAFAPGSYLAITHACTDTDTRLMLQTASDTVDSPAQTRFRTATEVRAWLGGVELFEPGLAPVQMWLRSDLPKTRMGILAAIGRTTEPELLT